MDTEPKDFAPAVIAYRELKKSEDVAYLHCSHCINDKPKEMKHRHWSQLEVVINPKTGARYIGCGRCNVPVVVLVQGD